MNKFSAMVFIINFSLLFSIFEVHCTCTFTYTIITLKKANAFFDKNGHFIIYLLYLPGRTASLIKYISKTLLVKAKNSTKNNIDIS